MFDVYLLFFDIYISYYDMFVKRHWRSNHSAAEARRRVYEFLIEALAQQGLLRTGCTAAQASCQLGWDARTGRKDGHHSPPRFSRESPGATFLDQADRDLYGRLMRYVYVQDPLLALSPGRGGNVNIPE